MDRAGAPRGFAASRTVALFLVTSLVSFAAIAVAGLGVATGLLSGEAALVATLLPAAGALTIVGGVALLPRLFPGDAETAEPAGRVRRLAWNARNHLREGLESTVALLRGGDQLVIWGSIGYFAFDVAAIAASFHAVGVAGLPVGLLILAYTLGHAGAIIPLPGSSEGGLIGVFVLYGATLSGATAAILAYRTVHAGVPMLMGMAGLADVRRQLRLGRPLLREERAPAPDAAGEPAPVADTIREPAGPGLLPDADRAGLGFRGRALANRPARVADRLGAGAVRARPHGFAYLRDQVRGPPDCGARAGCPEAA
jgi:hypothetical protein